MNGQFNRGEANGQLSAENGAGTVRYDYLLTRQVFLSGQELLEIDRFQRLTSRSTTTVALGYNFYDRLARSLLIGAGPGLIHEKFTTESATLSPAVSWFVDWHQDILDGRGTLFHNHHGIRGPNHSQCDPPGGQARHPGEGLRSSFVEFGIRPAL
jgi:hypothetical protein